MLGLDYTFPTTTEQARLPSDVVKFTSGKMHSVVQMFLEENTQFRKRFAFWLRFYKGLK